MVAKIDFSQFGHVALFVFVCRELWKNFPKKPEKKCWSQSFEISNWNILQDILITFFFQRSFSDTWKRLKMIVAAKNCLLRCTSYLNSGTPSVFVRRSIDVILVFLGMASVWIQLQLLDQKNISVLAMEWLISRIWNQRRRLNRVLLLNYRRICWFVCWFLFSSEATRSSVEALALQASVFFSSLLKGSLITSE